MSVSAPAVGDAERHEPGFAGTVRLVASREILTRVRSRAFVVMFVLLLLGAAAATILPNVVGGAHPVKVAVVGAPSVDLTSMKDADGTAYFDVVGKPVDRAEADRMLREGTVDAALDFRTTLTVIGLRDTPNRAVEAFSAAPQVELVDPSSRDPGTTYFVSIAFALAFFLAAMLFGNQIAQSVVEEKSTRIVEILLSAIEPKALLTGKILGNAALAIVQVVALAAVALIGLATTGTRIGLGDLGAPILWFVAFFVFGFVMVSAMFAASASLISRAEDVGAVTTPVTTLLMVPYILSFVTSGNETFTRVLAWLPISSPISMPSLVFTGDAQWWEPIGSLMLLIATTVAVIALGQRIYRNSLLRTGARVPLKEALGRS